MWLLVGAAVRVNVAELRVALRVMVAFPVPYGGGMAVDVIEAVPLADSNVTVMVLLAGAEMDELLPVPLPPVRENGPR